LDDAWSAYYSEDWFSVIPEIIVSCWKKQKVRECRQASSPSCKPTTIDERAFF
jgi:hypothetical protein